VRSTAYEWNLILLLRNLLWLFWPLITVAITPYLITL